MRIFWARVHLTEMVAIKAETGSRTSMVARPARQAGPTTVESRAMITSTMRGLIHTSCTIVTASRNDCPSMLIIVTILP